MNATHTPGPWQVASEATATVLGPAKTGLRIIAVAESPDQTANARLIAAAPELLSALRDVLVSLEPYEAPGDSAINAAITFARAAIAKAKGEA